MSKKNPYENLIDAYVNNRKTTNLPLYDTYIEGTNITSKQALNNIPSIESYTNWLHRMRGDEKARKRRNLSLAWVEKTLNFYIDYLDKLKRGVVKLEDQKLPEGGGNYGGPTGGSYQERFAEIANYPEKDQERFVYSTFNWNDYDVYLTYYRSMGFYIPNGWDIDKQYTAILWDNKPSEWKWRKICLIFTGLELYDTSQRIPFVGGLINASDYFYNERRGWFMLVTLAFQETVSTSLIRRMEKALDKKDFNEQEMFAPVGPVSQQSNKWMSTKALEWRYKWRSK